MKQSQTAWARARRGRLSNQSKGERRLELRIADWLHMTSRQGSVDPAAYHCPGSVKK